MAWLTNLTDSPQQIPTLGLTVEAGASVEVPDTVQVASGKEPGLSPDLFKVTKTRPAHADVQIPDLAPAAVTVEEQK